MRDIKFSRVFPKHHPRAGDPTHFVEKIWTALMDHPDIKLSLFSVVNVPVLSEIHKNFHANEFKPKTTTIRAGHRWKEGSGIANEGAFSTAFPPCPTCKGQRIISTITGLPPK